MDDAATLSSFRDALARQRAASEVMYTGDVGPWLALWSQRDPVSLFGAWGPCKTGWDELRRTFTWVASRMKGCEDPRFDVEVAEVCGDFAYSVGVESARMSVDGGPPRPWRVRVTHVYRREDGDWKIIHRHGDFAPDDESPPA